MLRRVSLLTIIAGIAWVGTTSSAAQSGVPQFTVVRSGLEVRATHILELRTAIDAVRGQRGLTGYPWRDIAIGPGAVIRGIHLEDLRSALIEAYAVAGLVPPTFAEPIVPRATLIRATHFSELQVAVSALWRSASLPPAPVPSPSPTSAWAGPHVIDHVFTRDSIPANCGRPTPAPHYATSDGLITIWIKTAGATGGERAAFAWQLPNGRTFDTGDFQLSPGVQCWLWHLTLNGTDRFGDWSVSLKVNGSIVAGPFTAAVVGPEQPFIESVTVANNGLLKRVSPNAWINIHGQRLATEPFPQARDVLPTSAAGVQVSVNGAAVPLEGATSSWISAQIPSTVRGDSVLIRVHTPRGTSNPMRVPLTTASPGLLAHDDDRSIAWMKQGADFVSRSRPLQRGQTAVIAATGLGSVLRAPQPGRLTFDATEAFSTPRVSLGDVELDVLSAVMGDYPGIYKVLVQIPPDVPSGSAVPLRLSINGIRAGSRPVPVSGPGPTFPTPQVARIEHPPSDAGPRDNTVYTAGSWAVLTVRDARQKAPSSLTCSGANGYQTSSAVAAVSGESVTALVPPYADLSSGDYLDGTLTCVLIQRAADQELRSNAFSIRVVPPPPLRSRPGAMTLALLETAQQGAGLVHSQAVFKHRSTAGRVAAPNTRAEMEPIAAAFTPYIDAVRRISNGSASAVEIGRGPTGAPLILTRADVTKLDRWIGMLAAASHAAAMDGEPSVVLNSVQASVRRSGFFGSVLRGAFDCVNPLSWIDHALESRPSPSQSCSAVKDAIIAVPVAGAAALYETARDIHKNADKLEKAAVLLSVVGLEAQFVKVVGEVALRTAAAQAGTALIANVAAALSSRSNEDSAALMEATRKGFADGGTDVAMDFNFAALEGVFGEEMAGFAKAGLILAEKLDAVPSELTAPQAVPNGDGTYPLHADTLLGPVTVVTGRASLPGGEQVRHGQVALGEDWNLDVPFGTAPTRPDGSFEALIPRREVGSTIPPNTAVFYRIPSSSGGTSSTVFRGSDIALGGSSVALAPVSLSPAAPPSGGGSGCNPQSGFACPAD